MKMKHKLWFGIAAFLAAAMIVFSGCGDAAGGGTEDNRPGDSSRTAGYTSTAEDGSVYDLKIFGKDGRYAAQAGDSYELTVTITGNPPTVKISVGTVASAGVTLTLTPANAAASPFTVTISGEIMTGIEGNITCQDNTVQPPPETLTPSAAPADPDTEQELTGPITEDTTLGSPDRAVNYVWKRGDLLAVRNNATLTILPRTTIRFTQSGGGINVETGATIKAVGVDKLSDGKTGGRIRLVGGSARGSWEGVQIHSETDNELAYVEIWNAGRGDAAWESALYLYDGSASVTNCVIGGSASNGITTEGNGQFAAFRGNIVTNSGRAPVYAYSGLWSLRNIDGDNVFTGNTNNYIHVRSAGSISAGMVIRKLTVPWQVYSTFNVNDQAILSVEPGVEIRFNSGTGIKVSATAAIVMNGTAEERILLRGVNTNPGAWGDIEIHSNRDENSLSYVDIQNGGGGTATWNAALYLYDGAADVNNCTITGSGSNGITTEGEGCLRSFTGNAVDNSGKSPIHIYSGIYSLRNIGSGTTFTGNTNSYVHVRSDTSIAGNMTLKKLTIPYFLENGLNVSNGNGINPTLTVEPGTHIWVNGQKSISVDTNAKLAALGTAAEPILFRGSTDQAGWWHGITVRSLSQGTRFDHCEISGGGRAAGYSNNNCLFIWEEAYVNIRNTTFSKSNFYYVGFDSNASVGAYYIYSENVTFSPKGTTNLLANVWYEVTNNPTSETLPANNFTPSY
jgi:hypothetical protein